MIRKRRIIRFAVAVITCTVSYKKLITNLPKQMKNYSRKAIGVINSSCEIETGSKLIFTMNASSFPHPPEFTPISTLFPRYDYSQPKFACWYADPMHHPHFLQALLRCFSLWNVQPSHHPRVLYVPKRQFWKKIGNLAIFDKQFPISSGILRTLMNSYNVTVTRSWNEGTPLRPQRMSENDEYVSSFAMSSLEHTISWKKLFVPPEEEPTVRLAKKRLKIAVVNRPKGRKLLNAMDARDNLAAAFPEHHVFEHHLNGTLEEMIDFFPYVDVLVTPHGSQLTGIMFMQRCSAVLEMFPHLYYTPHYFSSLARLFQLPHANWYVSHDAVPTKMLDLNTRIANSANNMCPSMSKLVTAVDELIKKRQDCLGLI